MPAPPPNCRCRPKPTITKSRNSISAPSPTRPARSAPSAPPNDLAQRDSEEKREVEPELILPRDAGEGDHAKHGGGGNTRSEKPGDGIETLATPSGSLRSPPPPLAGEDPHRGALYRGSAVLGPLLRSVFVT